MQLIELVEQILETGVLPMHIERTLQKVMGSREFNAYEMAVVDRLLEALIHGHIQPIA